MDILACLDKRNDVDETQKARIRAWLEKDFDEKTKEEVRRMIQENDSLLVDAFYTTLSFGTGGLRGIMGVGSNRMNEYTVMWATQGLANYIKKCTIHDPRVAIGYDSRHRSKEFAEESARVLAGNGIKVFLFDELRPTPLVSFACRYYKCTAAIMITASHNPPQYNGYKVYWDDGGQVLPPHDTGIIQEVQKVHEPLQVKKSSFPHPLITLIGKEVDQAYLKAIAPLRLYPTEKKEHAALQVLYSNLHGTGITEMPEALRQAGFCHVGYVEAQKMPDGDFPTTKCPNPEEKQALKIGVDMLLKEQFDLLIATDPDADRVGVVVNHRGEAVPLTGNQVACLLAKNICETIQKGKEMPQQAAFIKSIVTTELFRSVVTSFGALCVDVLTGFKYIAEKIRAWEETPDSHTFVFGAEESSGYLYGAYVRDKDAISTSCLIAEIASHEKKLQKTLVDAIDEIYLEWGAFSEWVIPLQFEESKSGKEQMATLMKRLRNTPPHSFCNLPIVCYTDILEQYSYDIFKDKKDPIALPPADVLIFELEDSSKVIVRPSGTEPKIKVYLMLKEALIQKTRRELEEAKKRMQGRKEAFEKEIRGFINLPYA